MNHAMLDERQISVRSRITANSFALTLMLALLNGFLTDTFHRWGSGLDQAFALVWIGLVTVTAQAVWRGAYFTSARDRRNIVITMSVLLVLFLAGLIRNFAQHRLSIWTNGHTGSDFLTALFAAYFLVMIITTAARTVLDQHAENEE